MSVPANVAALLGIGWRADPTRALPPELGPDARIARVTAQHRNRYELDDGTGPLTAMAAAGMIRRGGDPLRRPAVGDFVVLDASDPPLVTAVLPRRSLLKRGAAGERQVVQALAANVDTALVVCGLDLDYNPRRIERYLAVIEGSGVAAVVVLTKADKDPQAQARGAELTRLLGPMNPVLVVNAKSPDTREQLAPWTRPGDTLVLLGMSGAGKSTLTNTLLGIEKQKTSEVRDKDSRGRHTTTHRALIQLPSGACIIDTPGMRELKLTGEESLDLGHFREIEALAHDCRFRDCRHRNEPGCAVRAALEAGTLDPERYAHYQKLLAERDHAAQAQVAGAQRRSDRVANKALNRRLDEKYGSH